MQKKVEEALKDKDTANKLTDEERELIKNSLKDLMEYFDKKS